MNENINQNTDTEGMTTQSIANFNEKLNQAKEKLKEVERILNNSPSVTTIRDQIQQVNNAKMP